MIKGKVMWFGSKTLTTTVKEGQELIVRGPKYVVWLGLYPMFIYAILMFLDLDSDTVLYTFLGLTLSTLLIFFIPPIR
ncbi:MAG: hypothetical protein VX772_08235, partial [Bacteroidota bacterium]|nr:hypothetical protein [Bacteroidota bacterium]